MYGEKFVHTGNTRMHVPEYVVSTAFTLPLYQAFGTESHALTCQLTIACLRQDPYELLGEPTVDPTIPLR